MTETASTPTVNGQSEFIWYYHPDDLGSTGFVTDQNGELYEHIEYFPFGETWVQEHSNTQRTPYLYTGKELDEETGLYYYGARYYDPRTSVWQSADPILGEYLSGSSNGGVFSPSNLALYSYTRNNPIRFKDPDGNEWFDKSNLTPQKIASGRYLEVSFTIGKTPVVLYTDNPNEDIKGTKLVTASHRTPTPIQKAPNFKARDPGDGFDRPTEIANPVITSGVSSARKHPTKQVTRAHKGIDISDRVRRSAGIANTSIVAPRGGKVRKGNQAEGAGNFVVIDHGGGWETKLMHANTLSVDNGDYVSRGEAVGTVGRTGGVSSGEHIHWELRQNGQVVNPNGQLNNPIETR